jgi:hypothetical protein
VEAGLADQELVVRPNSIFQNDFYLKNKLFFYKHENLLKIVLDLHILISPSSISFV